MKYIAYYTPLYIDFVDKIKQSATGIDLIIKEVSDKGGWQKNTHFKPIFIKEMLELLKEPIVYVDIDATFEKNPNEYFDNLDCDVAVHKHKRSRFEPLETLTGTLYFNYNEKVMSLLDKWIDVCQDDFHVFEQEKLGNILKNYNEIRVVDLPVEYCAIFDHKNSEGKDVYIKHWQASRTMRKD